MITCQLALCAERTIQDATTNTISLIGVLERIRPIALPVILASVSCYFVLNRNTEDPGEAQMVLRFTIGDAEVLRREAGVNFQGALQARLVVNFFGFPLTTAGTFKVTLGLGDNIVGTYECQIEVPNAPAQMILPNVTRPD